MKVILLVYFSWGCFSFGFVPGLWDLKLCCCCCDFLCVWLAGFVLWRFKGNVANLIVTLQLLLPYFFFNAQLDDIYKKQVVTRHFFKSCVCLLLLSCTPWRTQSSTSAIFPKECFHLSLCVQLNPASVPLLEGLWVAELMWFSPAGRKQSKEEWYTTEIKLEAACWVSAHREQMTLCPVELRLHQAAAFSLWSRVTIRDLKYKEELTVRLDTSCTTTENLKVLSPTQPPQSKHALASDLFAPSLPLTQPGTTLSPPLLTLVHSFPMLNSRFHAPTFLPAPLHMSQPIPPSFPFLHVPRHHLSSSKLKFSSSWGKLRKITITSQSYFCSFSPLSFPGAQARLHSSWEKFPDVTTFLYLQGAFLLFAVDQLDGCLGRI